MTVGCCSALAEDSASTRPRRPGTAPRINSVSNTPNNSSIGEATSHAATLRNQEYIDCAHFEGMSPSVAFPNTPNGLRLGRIAAGSGFAKTRTDQRRHPGRDSPQAKRKAPIIAIACTHERVNRSLRPEGRASRLLLIFGSIFSLHPTKPPYPDLPAERKTVCPGQYSL